jgi:hypothetical protein
MKLEPGTPRVATLAFCALLAVPCGANAQLRVGCPERALGAPAGEPMVGLFRSATPLLRDEGCARPVGRTELTLELSDTDRQELLDERRTPQAPQRPGGVLSVLGGGNDEDGARREMTGMLSDVLGAGLLGWQVMSDVTLHDRAGLRDEAAVEILVTDALAHALAQGLVLGLREGSEALAACPPGEPECQASALRPSGRAAMAFTSASLMCLHRQMAGVGMEECAGGLALASAVGVLQGLGGEHDVGDVLSSAAIGLVSGYLIPAAALYAFGRRAPGRTRDPARRRERDEPGDWGIEASIAPSFSGQRGIGLTVQGTF